MFVMFSVNYPKFLSDFNEPWKSSTHFRKIQKLHENLSIVGRVVQCECIDGQTDMTTLIVAFSIFANAHKTWILLTQYLRLSCKIVTGKTHCLNCINWMFFVVEFPLFSVSLELFYLYNIQEVQSLGRKKRINIVVLPPTSYKQNKIKNSTPIMYYFLVPHNPAFSFPSSFVRRASPCI
jgi:hypothetical protein